MKATWRISIPQPEWTAVILIVWGTGFLLYPVFCVSRHSRPSLMLSRMKIAGLSVMMYTQDYDERFPPSSVHWEKALLPYLKDPLIFEGLPEEMPPKSENVLDRRGMAINRAVYGKQVVAETSLREQRRHPATVVLFCETHYRYRQDWPWQKRRYFVPREREAPDTGADTPADWQILGEPAATRRNGGSYYAFADGHAGWQCPDQVHSWYSYPGDVRAPGFSP